MALQISVLYGSVREARRHQARASSMPLRGPAATTLVDAMECRLPLLNRMYKEFPPGRRRR